MTTITQFAPTQQGQFIFQATLLGPTANVTSTGTLFNVTVFWNVFGQRWWFSVIDQNGNLVLSKPLVASPADYPINLVGGYFTGSSLVFTEAGSQFVVVP